MDSDEFRSIFERIHPELICCLERGWVGPNGKLLFLKTRGEAEDVAAEAWTTLLENMRAGKFDGSRPIEPYVLGIARNLALAKIRKHYVHAQKTPALGTFLELNVSDDAAMDEVLHRGIQELDEPYRSILAAKRDGLAEHEIGAQLGLSRDQVQRRYVKALRALRAFFVREGVLSDSFESLQVVR